MKTKLWIDDLRDPKDYVPDPENWKWVKTARDAVRELYGMNRYTNEPPFVPYTHVSFDHDLGANEEEDEEESGYTVAYTVEADAATHKQIKPFAWVIHSANPVGAKKIRMAMESAERFWKNS